MNVINKLPENSKAILILFILVAIIASLQGYFGGLTTLVPAGKLYTRYNNYIIFKQSFFHLIGNQDLYAQFVDEQGDLYKYSPAFALIFGFFAWLPDVLGLTLWNLLNSLILFLSIYFLPNFSTRIKGLLLITVVIELLTSIQNEQSNGLIAGLLIFGFGFLERRNYWMASLMIVLSIFIKLFGIVAFALFLLYPNKLKLAYTTCFWCIIFLILPLIAVSIDQLLFLYKSWVELLANDRSISDGLSVIGWLKTWFGLEVNKMAINILGIIVFCIPLLKIKSYTTYRFRLLILASVMLWVVIFNHRAESPTFIIAMSGVAIWYFTTAPNKINLVLLLMAVVFTCLSPTDIFPRFVREEWMKPYVVKAVPCILIWFKVTLDLIAPRDTFKLKEERE